MENKTAEIIYKNFKTTAEIKEEEKKDIKSRSLYWQRPTIRRHSVGVSLLFSICGKFHMIWTRNESETDKPVIKTWSAIRAWQLQISNQLNF